MKYTFAFAIALFLFIAGCFHEPKVKECGTDEACFNEAAKTCSPARVTRTEQSGTMDFSLKGWEGDKCVMYMKIIDSSVPLLKDKDMTCKLPVAELAKFGKGSGSKVGMEELSQWCSGSFIDLMRSLGLS